MIFNFKSTGGGDAETLQGHGAEYFAPLSRINGDYLTTSILEKALTAPLGISEYKLGGDGYNGGDLPHYAWTYSTAIVYKRAANSIVVMLVCELYDRTLINRYGGTTWTGWVESATTADLANYLPKTGGKVASTHFAPLVIEGNHDTYDLATVEFARRGTSYGHLGLAGANKPVFMTTGGFPHALLHDGNVGDYALPLTGGIVANALQTPITVQNTTSGSNTTFIKYRGSQFDMGSLGFAETNVPAWINNDGSAWYPLHHDGNSAKVHIGTSAPSDTTALWIDTSA